MLKDISLGAMSVFSSLLAILATANFLPKDIEDRTIYTILAKPVPRFSYLLGKLVGILLLLALSILLMTGLFLAVLWLRERGVLFETRAQMAGGSAEDLALALKEVTNSTFNANLFPGIVIIFVKSALLASLTLFLSTFASSGLFAILMAIAIYFIGHLQATAREFWLAGVDVHWWARLLSALVALLFPDLQAFNYVDDVICWRGGPGRAVPADAGSGRALRGGLFFSGRHRLRRSGTMMGTMMARRSLAVVLLAGFGAVLVPLQIHLAGEAKAANFRKTALNLDLRERIGQMGFWLRSAGSVRPWPRFSGSRCTRPGRIPSGGGWPGCSTP